MNGRVLVPLAVIAVMTAGAAFAQTASQPSADASTSASQSLGVATVIGMPKGSIPEGIAIGGSTAFVTSLAHGAIYKVDLDTGVSQELKSGKGPAAGIMLDEFNRLFVAGGPSGMVEVIDAKTGKTLASYKVAEGDATFVNDFARLGDAIYVTDSVTPAIYKLPLGPDGALPSEDEIETIALTGITYGDGFNANGISQTPDESALLIVQTNPGILFRVDAATGEAVPVEIGDADVEWGDGLLREGNTLYVVRNMPNKVAVLELDATGSSGRLKAELSDPGFDTPTTIARYGDRLFLPNARFSVADPASADFTISVITYTP